MNKTIVVAVLVIGGSGVVNSIMKGNGKLTPVVLGSYVLLLVLSIADAFGDGLAKLSSAIAMLAMVYVILTVFPWAEVLKVVGGKPVTIPHNAPTNTPTIARRVA